MLRNSSFSCSYQFLFLKWTSCHKNKALSHYITLNHLFQYHLGPKSASKLNTKSASKFLFLKWTSCHKNKALSHDIELNHLFHYCFGSYFMLMLDLKC